MTARPIRPLGPINATVRLPGSKSITNRALLCAALARGTSELTDLLIADDTLAMIECLGRLGAEIEIEGTSATITRSVDGRGAAVDARQSGTTSRFLLPVLALAAEPRELDGDEQLRSRPMGAALDALRALGVHVSEHAASGHLPVTVRGPVIGGEVSISGDVTSQFLSGLLLAAPRFPEALHLTVTTELVSRPYVDMTVSVMGDFGADVDVDPPKWHVSPTGYRGTGYRVEPDASAASYAWAAAVITGGRATVPGLHVGSLQGDVAFASILEQMGADVVWEDDAITVAAGPAGLRGIDVDMEHVSDTVPTLAAVAAFADSPTRIRNVGFIRGKESDRIAGPVAELRRLGLDATETDDGLIIRPGPMIPAKTLSYGDHRMAMSCALIGLRVPGVMVDDPDCVAKTFPGFWDMLDSLDEGAVEQARVD